MSAPAYFRLISISANGVVSSVRSREEIRSDPRHCNVCLHPIDRSVPFDSHFKEASAGPEHISFEEEAVIGLIRVTVLDQLGIDVEAHGMLLGEVRNGDGDLQGEWRSYVCRTEDIVRSYTTMHKSGDLTYYRCCKGCGRKSYFEGTERAGYMLRHSDRDPDIIMNCQLGGILIPAHLLNGVKPERKPGMGVQEISISDMPQDGYPVKLPCPPPIRPWDAVPSNEPPWMAAKRRQQKYGKQGEVDREGER